MRNILFGVIITLVMLFLFKFCNNKRNDTNEVNESSVLIKEQIENVGKLVVIEGHFSDVFNYKNSKEIFGKFFTSDKKALIVVNADVTIAYNLKDVKFRINEENKTLHIISIPKEEIKIHPDLEYYDVESDYFNPFEAEDYNEIKKTINTTLIKKINNSDLKKNAKNRLMSELSKFYILTRSLGWTLKYNETGITSIENVHNLKL